MVQWINLNGNNRYVFAHQYSVLGEKTSPILLLLLGLTNKVGVREGGREGGREGSRLENEMWVGFEIFKTPYS